MDKIKQNLSLVVGLGIPVLMTLIIACIIYIPRVFDTTPPPVYDILYIVADDGSVVFSAPNAYAPYPSYPVKGVWPKYLYRVSEGKLVRQENIPIPDEYKNMPLVDTPPKFYLHRVATNQSSPITFADAEKYHLDTSAISPDGWTIAHGECGGGFFPFSSSPCNYQDRFLKKGSTAIKLNLNLPREYYQEPSFMWIVE